METNLEIQIENNAPENTGRRNFLKNIVLGAG